MTGSKRRGVVLQDRDRSLLHALHVMRVMDRDDVQAIAKFGSVTRANARLLQLTTAGLLTRLPYGTRLGGQRLLYAVTRAGARAIEAAYRPPLWPAHATLAWNPTLEHQLIVNRVYRRCIAADAEGRGVLAKWRTFLQPWSDAIRVMPDAYAEFVTADGSHAIFFEIDRGTESRRIWTRKVQAYLALARSGEVAERLGQPRFQVAVIVPSARRLHSIRHVIAQHTTKLFWLASIGTKTEVPLFEAAWLRPNGDAQHHLI